VRAKGWNNQFYDDFYEEIYKWNSSIGMVWVNVEGIENLFIMFWAGDEPNQAFLDIMKEAESEIDYGVSFEGIGITIAYERKDMVLENILQKNKLIYKLRDDLNYYEYYLDVTEFENYYDKEADFESKKIDFSNATNIFNTNFEDAANSVKIDGINKYALGTIKKGRVLLDEVGTGNFEFVRNRVSENWKDDPQIMFYKFEYENKNQTVALFLCKIMKLNKAQDKVIFSLKNVLMEAGVSLYPIVEPDYFDLDILINVGAIPDPDFRIHILNDLIQ